MRRIPFHRGDEDVVGLEETPQAGRRHLTLVRQPGARREEEWGLERLGVDKRRLLSVSRREMKEATNRAFGEKAQRHSVDVRARDKVFADGTTKSAHVD